MSIVSKNNPCTPCRIECTGKASLTMTIKRIFRSTDCTPPPCVYQWDADYDFGQTEITNFHCNKTVDRCGKDIAGIEIATLLGKALTKWKRDKLGDTTPDSDYRPDIAPDNGCTDCKVNIGVNAEVEFYVMIIVKKSSICFPECEAIVIPNGQPKITIGPFQ